ncbi:hypothetical protein PPL_06866 [Heterostelium album PN500]|uniref:B box-type domain-containing protein n=1 Tax=Heterostelium pallidum (strain ATCC 26659 / Pp 5 / PN500) TaxID=670386 RepID=D3BDR4_HETP5|nr:hypothetical protein PPL_06866 [Heterostelium album PN500]EFA80045.1 hypothetical protein PPL_06866 [Heterostelium album PN500]|eukprot:XP_020432165.1 hypothetical protein PPL_06866 [Heterostelium album PN500]
MNQCDVHQQKLKLLCSNCKINVCIRCVTDTHRGHSFDHIQQTLAHKRYRRNNDRDDDDLVADHTTGTLETDNLQSITSNILPSTSPVPQQPYTNQDTLSNQQISQQPINNTHNTFTNIINNNNNNNRRNKDDYIHSISLVPVFYLIFVLAGENGVVEAQNTSTIYYVNTYYNSSDCGSEVVEIYGYDTTGCIPYTFGSYLYICNDSFIGWIEYSDSACGNETQRTVHEYNTCYPQDPYYSQYTCQTQEQLLQAYPGYTGMNQYTNENCNGEPAGLNLSPYPLCDAPFAVKCEDDKLYISEGATDFCVKYGAWKEYTEPQCADGTFFQCCFVIELPLLISVFSFIWYIPAGLTDSYLFILNWIGPVLVLIQAYQSINLILFTNRKLMEKTLDPSYDTPIKLFTDDTSKLSSFNSNILSSVVTILVLLIPFMIFVEDSMLLDIAMITFFVALQCFSYFYSGVNSYSVYVINCVSVVVSLITLLSLTITIGQSDSSSTITDNSLFGNLNESDNKESIYQIIHIMLVIALTYFPMSYFGVIEPVSWVFPVLQIVFQFALYTLSCLQNSNLIKLHDD